MSEYRDNLNHLVAVKDAEIERLTKINSETRSVCNFYIQANAELEAENASLKAQVERLSAPVSDEELPGNTSLHIHLRNALSEIIASRTAKEKPCMDKS